LKNNQYCDININSDLVNLAKKGLDGHAEQKYAFPVGQPTHNRSLFSPYNETEYYIRDG
jgi:hypothetical protein